MKIKYLFLAVGLQIMAILLPTFSAAQTSCGDVTDIDGNVYPTVKIGTQCWMQKNLDVSKYRNGDVIPQVTDPAEWGALTTGAWCYYKHNTANGAVYGKLYNWYAVNDPRGLAPKGCHIPSNGEWTTLTSYLGGEKVAGGKMKDTKVWNSPNTGATNSSGFLGTPGGYRYYWLVDDPNDEFTFYSIGEVGNWWSYTENDFTSAFLLFLNHNSNLAYGPEYRAIQSKRNGLSIRCIKDNTSWIGFYNIIEDNPIIFPKPQTLWAGSTSEDTPPIKICADGSKATLIKYVNTDSSISINDIHFRVKSNSFKYNEELNGVFSEEATDYHISGDTIYAKYTHPQYVNENVVSTNDIIEVFNSSDEKTIYKIPIEIYHAPVLMVHGIWASRKSFEDMENELHSSIYPSVLTWRADYEKTNSFPFAYNENVVPSNINALLMKVRNQNYSAGKVIVVGHSMGGILTRKYLQSSAYRNDIQKIITLNTPHSGTQVASLLTDYPKIKDLLTYFGKDCYKGAVDDLMFDSQAIKILNGSSLHNHDVPSQAISTVTSWRADCGWPSYLIATAAPLLSLSTTSLLQKVYNSESNDLIVPLSSQQGSSLSNAPVSTNQCHMGSTDNSEVITEVKSSIKASPSWNTFFLQSGFDPPKISKGAFRISPPKRTENSVSAGEVTIMPILESYHPGDNIPLKVTSTGNINHLIVATGDSSGDINYTDSPTGETTYNYNVPLDVMGKIKIIAIGYDNEGFVALDTIQTKVVLDNATLDNLELYGDTIYVEVNKTASISTTAYFSNGYHYDESMLTNVQYQITDTKYANYVGSNIIQGKEVGITTLQVTYLDQTKSISVVVLPEDTSLGIKTVNPNDNISNPEILNLNVYPNPTNGIFTLEIQASYNDNLKIEIHDLLGRKIYEKKYWKNETKHEIDIRENASGIYIISVKDEKNNLTVKKIVKM